MKNSCIIKRKNECQEERIQHKKGEGFKRELRQLIRAKEEAVSRIDKSVTQKFFEDKPRNSVSDMNSKKSKINKKKRKRKRKIGIKTTKVKKLNPIEDNQNNYRLNMSEVPWIPTITNYPLLMNPLMVYYSPLTWNPNLSQQTFQPFQQKIYHI